MLHELLARDITGFNVRNVPTTEGLQQQRKLSLPTAELWWLDVLERGHVSANGSTWAAKASTAVLFDSYRAFAKDRNERHPLNRDDLGAMLKKWNSGQDRRRWRIGTDEHGVTIREYGYIFGDLDEARAKFSAATGLDFDWDDDSVELHEDED